MNALGRVIGKARCKTSLIELQTFVSDAVRIANDCSLRSVSTHPNDLLPNSLSSFLGQRLARNTPISALDDRGDLRHNYLYNVILANNVWKSGTKGYLATLQSRSKW